MLGTYRLCLAMLVALSHIGVGVMGLNPGVVAVVGFYLVSGYVMTGLFRAHYARADKITGFYRDRVLRLYPHYLVIAIITLVWFALSGARADYLRTTPTLRNLLENALVVPLNFFMFNHSDHFTLIPPAWSLGAEVQFYIVFPLVLLAGLRFPVLIASSVVYVAASMGSINSDWYGYRLLPGVLWMFLLGSWLFDIHQRTDRRSRGMAACLIVSMAVVALAFVLELHGTLKLPYNRETLIGLVAGILVVNTVAYRPRRPLDDMLGNLSYGVFLSHFLVMGAFFGGRVNGVANTVAFLAITVAIAFTMYMLVESPMLRLRRRLRRAAPAMTAGSSTNAAN